MNSWLGKRIVAGLLLVAPGIVACGSGDGGNPAASGLGGTGGVSGCPVGTVQCGPRCVDLAQNPLNCGNCGVACPAGMGCVAGLCTCRVGLTQCTTGCADIASDPANCGACGTACVAPQVCSLGACSATCAAGLTQCGQSCVDPAQDELNCGACGAVCASDQTCAGGACTCSAGLLSCGGVCVNAATDVNNCGAYGVVCTGGALCTAGACACPAGQSLCDGACIVGTCTGVGGTGGDATGGALTGGALTGGAGTGGDLTGGVLTGGTGGDNGGCLATEALCDGVCVDVSANDLQCGACGVQCTNGQSCVSGICTCPAGTSFCGGACVGIQANPAHCGACGAVCTAPGTCAAGVCSCTNGQPACAGACTDVATDAENCGTCGTVCASGSCVAGVCTLVKDCFQKTVITSPIFTNFDDYDGTVPVDTWGFAFNAPAGATGAVYAGPYHFGDGTGTQTLGMDTGYSSTYSINIANTQASAWGGALAFWTGCIDVSAYDGIALWVRGTAPSGNVSLSLTAEATSPPATDPAGGGTCTTGCAEASIEFAVTTAWTRVLLPWSSFTPGTADGADVPVTGDGITGFTVSVPLTWVESPVGSGTYVPSPAAVGIELDDIQFITADVCPVGQTLCGIACVDTATSNAHCGQCNFPCDAARTCSGGVCQCPAGYSNCSGECVDTAVDAQHCGACGAACSGVCTGGSCQASTCAAGMPHVGETCTSYATIDLGKYWLNNNVWGASGASGSQCIWRTCQSGNTIGWGTSYNWSGATNQVKSFASSVLGWHWGWHFPAAQTGLPVQLSANRTINCAWTYQVPSSGTFNVTYDLWAHSTSSPTSTNDPTDEIMIWLYRGGGAGPIGTLQTSVTLAGTSWDLYRGNNGYWNVFSFVRSSNTNSATLNLQEFLADLVSRGWMANTKYLTSIEAGTEVFVGTGEVNTDTYYCTIQ